MRGFLLIVLLLVVCRGYAQNDTLKIQEVEIQGNRIPAFFNEKQRVVMIISREEIALMPVTSLDELLEYVSNVDVRSRGAMGVQSDIGIRGGNCEQLAVLLNGVKINDPQTGHHNLNIPLDLTCINRIEVLQGPGTRLYGPGAFSGAINIITSPPVDKGMKVQAESGDYNFINTNVGLYYKWKFFSNLLSVSHKSSSGYRENTDFRTSNAFWFGQQVSKYGVMTSQVGYNDKSFGANSFYTSKYPNQFERTRAFIASIRYEMNNKLHLRPQIYYRRHQDRFELFRDNFEAPAWYLSHNYHLSHVSGVELSSWFSWAAGKTSFGAEYRTEYIISNVLGEPLDNPEPVPFEAGAVFTNADHRDVVSAFADHQFQYRKLNASFGGLVYHSQLSGTRFFPGADLSLELSNSFNLFASYSQSLRLPSFTELYYKSTQHIPNSSLLPEEAMNAETGLKYNSKGINGGISLYYRKGINIIDWVRINTADKWQAANITEVESMGTEFFAKIYLPVFVPKSPVTLLHLRMVYNFLQKTSGDYYSLYALDYLGQKYTLTVQHKLYKNFSASWTLMYQQRMGTYTEFSSNDEKPYPDVVTLDGRISWNYKIFQVYADASNILNNSYMDIGNIPMPGRWFRMGVVVSPVFK
ncbi:MAG: TonB-dependent receptor [Bacteroidetes bacterium HGW-Bacteroidetes-21]|nr:MAG: TonB-dependent receptor [Bacteroidetes bacterium HGW-Bacteroidetes-21]